MYRVARLIVLVVVCVGLALAPVVLIIFGPAIGGAIGLVRQRLQPRPVVRVPPPAAPATIELPPEPPRKGRRTWGAVEATFDEARGARDEHPAWKDNPSGVYEMVANPAYTDSDEILDHSVKLAEWRREMPNSATAVVVLARAHLDWAWQARGYGPVSSMSEERQGEFFTRVAEARRLLEEAIELGVKDGEAYRLLIRAGMGEGRPREEVRAALDEGRRIDPTYFPMYTQYAQYLLPRWHGERGDVERFAAEMAEALGGDDGLEVYARIAASIHQTDYERELIYFGEYDKRLLVKGAEVLMRRRDYSRDEVNFAALCAWVARDREVALRLKEKMGEEVERDPIWFWSQHRREFDSWCRLEEFAAVDDSRWFWGSIFCNEAAVFWKDSKSVWCGGGYGPRAMNLVDIESGRIRMSLRSRDLAVECFAVDGDQGLVAAAIRDELFQNKGYKAIRVWKLDEFSEPLNFKAEQPCTSIAIRPGRPQIAWSPVGTVECIDLETGERKQLLKAPQAVRKLRYSADGRWLIVTSDYETIWDAETGQLVHEMPNTRMRPIPKPWCLKVLEMDGEGRIWALVEHLEPGKREISLVRYAADAKSFDAVKLDESLTGDLHAQAVLSADFRLLAVNTIRQNKSWPRMGIDVWNVETGKKVGHYAGHIGGFFGMSFSPDGKWLATTGFPTGLVKIWPLERGEERE